MGRASELLGHLERTQRFVGRAGVLRRLKRVMDDLSRQSPRVGLCLVVGEEGVGKGRLLLEVMAHAQGKGVRCLAARPRLSAYETYRPFADVLGPASDASSGGALPPGVLPPRLDGAMQARLKERALGRLRSEAAVRPLALFLHELDRADPFTFDLLDYLPRHREKAPCVIVASVSPDTPGFPFEKLRGEPFCRELALPPWTAADVEKFLRSRPGTSRIAGPLAELLMKRTEGRPAMVLEVLKLMEEERRLPDAGQDARQAMERLHGFRVPASFIDLVGRRLTLRSPDERSVLVALAVLARPGTVDETAAVSGVTAAEAGSALDDAARAGLVLPRITRGVASFEVKSRQLGQAVIAASAPELVAEHHRRLAARIENLPADDVDPVELAFHHTRAGNAERAASAALRARERLLELRAFDQGLAIYEECLSLSPPLPERARLLMGVADFSFGQSAFDRALRYVRAALGEVRSLGQKLQVAECLLREARIHAVRSEFVLAAKAAHEAFAIFLAEQDLRGKARALGEIGAIEYGRGRFEDARTAFRDAAAIQRQCHDRPGLFDSLNYLGNIHFYRGEYDDARGLYTEAREIARELGAKLLEKRCQTNLANLHFVSGQRRRAYAVYRAVLAIERDLGDIQGEGVTHYNLGVALEGLGRLGHAVKEYQAAIRIMERAGDRRALCSALGNLSSLHRNAGDLARAHEYLHKASRIAHEIGDRRSETSVLVGLGTYHVERRNRERAFDYLEAALAKAIAMRDRRFEMEARATLAQAALAFGMKREVAGYCQSLLALARTGGEPEYLMRAYLAEGLRALEARNAELARANLMTALGIARRAHLVEVEATLRAHLATALEACGEPESAARQRERAKKLFGDIASRMGDDGMSRTYLATPPRKALFG